jgi:RHS repeat-associated protein
MVYASDYYAFGSEMPERQLKFPSHGSPNYRYGFNGKEKDPEAAWGDTSYDYGFRIYNPRYARFLSVDPLTKSYPMLTPYQFASNMPINSIDLDGLEQLVAIRNEGQDKPIFYTVSDEDGRRAIETQFWLAFKNDLDPGKFIWLKGENEYKRSGSLYAPLFGTLNIDVRSAKTYLSFDPTPHKRIKRDFRIIESYQKFRQTYEGEQFEETLSNVALAGSMLITGGASSYVRLSGSAAKYLQSSFGKGIFDIVGQAIVKGDVNKIDISDAAASALVANGQLRNLIKSFADLTIEGGFSKENIKGVNDGLAEFGLRLVLDAGNSPMKDGAAKYVVDIIKKEQQKEIKSTISGSN